MTEVHTYALAPATLAASFKATRNRIAYILLMQGAATCRTNPRLISAFGVLQAFLTQKHTVRAMEEYIEGFVPSASVAGNAVGVPLAAAEDQPIPQVVKKLEVIARGSHVHVVLIAYSCDRRRR